MEERVVTQSRFLKTVSEMPFENIEGKKEKVLLISIFSFSHSSQPDQRQKSSF